MASLNQQSGDFRSFFDNISKQQSNKQFDRPVLNDDLKEFLQRGGCEFNANDDRANWKNLICCAKQLGEPRDILSRLGFDCDKICFDLCGEKDMDKCMKCLSDDSCSSDQNKSKDIGKDIDKQIGTQFGSGSSNLPSNLGSGAPGKDIHHSGGQSRGKGGSIGQEKGGLISDKDKLGQVFNKEQDFGKVQDFGQVQGFGTGQEFKERQDLNKGQDWQPSQDIPQGDWKPSQDMPVQEGDRESQNFNINRDFKQDMTPEQVLNQNKDISFGQQGGQTDFSVGKQGSSDFRPGKEGDKGFDDSRNKLGSNLPPNVSSKAVPDMQKRNVQENQQRPEQSQ